MPGPAPHRRRRHRRARAARARHRRPSLARHRASPTSRRSRAPTPATSRRRAAASPPAARCRRVNVNGRALRLIHSARRHRGAQRDLLRRRLGGPARRGCGRRPRPAHRPLPRRVPAPAPGAASARALADLPGARPGAAVPRRAPDQAHRRRGASRPDGADGRRARRLPARRACARATCADTLAWPGTWRMLARWWRTGDHRAAPRRAALGVRPRRRPLRARAAHRRRRAVVRRRARAGARPRRQARRRLRLLAHRARAARAQRALAGGDLLARDRPLRGRRGRAGVRLAHPAERPATGVTRSPRARGRQVRARAPGTRCAWSPCRCGGGTRRRRPCRSPARGQAHCSCRAR